MSDLMSFLLDDTEQTAEPDGGFWNILIVDDEKSVHEATKFVLSDFSYAGRGINWLDAYSAEEAKYIVHENRDLALMFLDVVMETDDAGLVFAKWFRDAGVNPATRIVLRTGQPGLAPVPQIIVNYDLHDYKTKTELSSGKLFAATVSALRAYEGLNRLEATKRGLENIISASVMLFKIQSMGEFALGMLRHFKEILKLDADGFLCAWNKQKEEWRLIAATNMKNCAERYAEISSAPYAREISKNEIIKTLYETQSEAYVLVFGEIGFLNDIQEKMLEMLYANVSIGLSNIVLYNELLRAHKSIVMSLAQITEERDSDTGRHVFRIALATELLAREIHRRNIYPTELDDSILEIIGLSSTLHDIGKISIPDAVLLKPGKLTPEEFIHIKEHPTRGAEILQSVMDYNNSNLRYIELGKQIAMHHHERWDGTGYPGGLSKNQIPIAARITAIVDVFDALINRRCYKKPLPVADCLEIIKEGRNAFFDPKIVDVFLDIFDDLYIKVWKPHETSARPLDAK